MTGQSDDSTPRPGDSGDGDSGDGDLERVVYQQFEDSAHHELRRISVRVDRDHVYLSGQVPSFFLKQMAQETARQACPNRRVYNELDVVEPDE